MLFPLQKHTPRALPAGVVLLTLLLCGCASEEIPIRSGIEKTDPHSLIAKFPVELPGGYDVDDFRRLRMAITMGNIQSNSRAFKTSDNERYMNLRFQSEMDKHKRFLFLALHGADTSVIDSLTDLGEIESDGGADEGAKYQAPELNLNWNINIQEQSSSAGKYGRTISWLCTVNATVSYVKDVKTPDGKGFTHRRGDVAFTQDFDLPRISRSQTFNNLGVPSGFSYSNNAAVQGIMQEIMIAASQRIADDLGKRFPVGGRISGALGNDLMTMEQGAEQGVEKGMEMVIFARVEGVDVPLANATAIPARDKSQLKVWRFAKDRHAEKFLQEIGDAPKQWEKKTGNQLFAVRAVPQQDPTKGTRFE